MLLYVTIAFETPFISFEQTTRSSASCRRLRTSCVNQDADYVNKVVYVTRFRAWIC